MHDLGTCLVQLHNFHPLCSSSLHNFGHLITERVYAVVEVRAPLSVKYFKFVTPFQSKLVRISFIDSSLCSCICISCRRVVAWRGDLAPTLYTQDSSVQPVKMFGLDQQLTAATSRQLQTAQKMKKKAIWDEFRPKEVSIMWINRTKT